MSPIRRKRPSRTSKAELPRPRRAYLGSTRHETGSKKGWRFEEKIMKVTLFGAGGGDVTGSAYLVESGKSKVLIDCGLFQGVLMQTRRTLFPNGLHFVISIMS